MYTIDMGFEIPLNRKDPNIVIQGSLALLVAGFDVREQDKEKQRNALMRWVDSGDAARFRRFVDTHPGIKMNPLDPVGMHKILKKMQTYH